LLRTTFQSSRFNEKLNSSADRMAVLCACIWAVHPLQTQAVTYVVQRIESLMALLVLLTMQFYIKGTRSEHRTFWYVVSAVTYVLAIATKEVAVVLPVLLVWYDRVFLTDSLKEILRRRWPLFVSYSAAWGVLGWLVLNRFDTYQGLAGKVEGLSSWKYLISQSEVILHYMQLLILPVRQCLDPAWIAADSISEVLIPCLVVLGMLIATVSLMFRHPVIAFAGGWFFLTLAPTSSFVPINDLAFEHRVYLASMSFLTLAVFAIRSGLAWIANATQRPEIRERLQYSTALLVLLILSLLTDSRNRLYASQLDMWSDVVSKAPHNVRALSNLGSEYIAISDEKTAEEFYDRALAIDPQYGHAALNKAGLLIARKEFQKAIPLLKTAIRTEDTANAHFNLGIVYYNLRRRDNAIDELRKAIRINPKLAAAHYQLAITYRDSRRLAEASDAVDIAIKTNVKMAPAYLLKSELCFLNKERDAGIEALREATRLDPNMTSYAQRILKNHRSLFAKKPD